MKSSKRITSVVLKTGRRQELRRARFAHAWMHGLRCWIPCFVLALSLMAAPATQSEAAGKAAISKKKVTLYVGKTDYPGVDNLKKVYENMSLFWDQESFDPSLVGRDTHPYGKLRGSVPLMMLDEFYDVFGVKEGDAMYIAPEDRTRIWS